MQPYHCTHQVGAYATGAIAKPMSPAEQLKMLKAQMGRARDEFFNWRNALRLAVAKSDGKDNDLDALDLLFSSWNRANTTYAALRAQVEQAEAAANG